MLRTVQALSCGILLLWGMFGCAPPPRPDFRGDEAGIDADRSLRSLTVRSDSVWTNVTYPCTLALVYPQWLDSVQVWIDMEGTDSLLRGGTVADSILSFDLKLQRRGRYELRVCAFRVEGTIDSLLRTVEACPLIEWRGPDTLIVDSTYVCSLLVNDTTGVSRYRIYLQDWAGGEPMVAGQLTGSAGTFSFGFPLEGSRIVTGELVYDDGSLYTAVVETLYFCAQAPPPVMEWRGPDTLYIETTYNCSLWVFDPSEVDSFRIYLQNWAGGFPIVTGPVIDSAGTFSFGFPLEGPRIVTGELVYKDRHLYTAVVETLYFVTPMVASP